VANASVGVWVCDIERATDAGPVHREWMRGSFTFANRCAATGNTKVRVGIKVGSNLLLNYHAHGAR
jgi:hypothetical protein